AVGGAAPAPAPWRRRRLRAAGHEGEAEGGGKRRDPEATRDWGTPSHVGVSSFHRSWPTAPVAVGLRDRGGEAGGTLSCSGSDTSLLRSAVPSRGSGAGR